MKENKGFTLIELLAVIVILAIIALITVPVVINIINNAKKGAAEDSTYGVLGAVKYFLIQNYKDFENNNDDILFTCNSNGNCTTTLAGSTATTLELSGAKPTSGTIRIQKDGVTVTNLKFGDYYCNKAKTEEKVNCGTQEIENNEPQNNQQPINLEVGTVVYFDPVTSNTCDINTYTGSDTCYKWNVISDDITGLTIQLDHNLIDDKYWMNTNYTSTGPNVILSQLAQATASWSNDRVPPLTYTYDTTYIKNNYGILSCVSGICNKVISKEAPEEDEVTLLAGTSEIPVRARLITADEISTLTLSKGASNTSDAYDWKNKNANTFITNYYFANENYILGTENSGTGDTSLSWLIQSSSNTNENYWTLSPVADDESFYSYVVDTSEGRIINYNGYVSTNGARPVITISKSLVSY